MSNFTPEQIDRVKRIHDLFKNTTMPLEQIAVEVGLDNVDQLRVLWTLADTSGLLDKLGF